MQQSHKLKGAWKAAKKTRDGYKAYRTERWKQTEKINDLDAEVYYAAVYSDENDDIKLTSSRAIAVLAVRDTISESEKACEEAISYINGEVYHRRDVATEALLNEKIEHMKEIRG